MTDTFSKAERSKLMASVKTKNTTPEIRVRKALHAMGYRFRLHRKTLPGKPDIVLPRYRTVIFVHGCFWHRHSCKKGQTPPKTNAAFWLRKIDRNVQRDIENVRDLEAQGWKVMIVWECETKPREKLDALLRERLSGKDRDR